MRETVSGPEELNMVIVCQREEVSPTLCCCMSLDKSNTVLLHAPGQEQHTCMGLYCLYSNLHIC